MHDRLFGVATRLQLVVRKVHSIGISQRFPGPELTVFYIALVTMKAIRVNTSHINIVGSVSILDPSRQDLAHTTSRQNTNGVQARRNVIVPYFL
jgi:hypothetical protein